MFINYAAYPQDCGCDYTINATFENGKPIEEVDAKKLSPTIRVICIAEGSRGLLHLTNFQGTSDKPYIFKNCGGQVKISTPISSGYALKISNSKHFRLTGTGNSSYIHGITINGGHNAMTVEGKSTNCEIDHVEIKNTGFAGMMVKTDPKCDGTANYTTFTMWDVKIHDNYIHHTKGEGLYVGHSFYAGWKVPSGSKTHPECIGSTLYPHAIKKLRLYNNKVEYTDWDAIQVGCANEDCEIYGNTVSNYGMNAASAHTNGIQIGEGTTGKLYNNKIIDGKGNGIILLGLGNNIVFNNQIIRAGQLCSDSTQDINGIFLDTRDSTRPNFQVAIINNTIVDPKGGGIKVYNTYKKVTNFQLHNNLIAGTNKGIRFESFGKGKESYNLQYPLINTAGFVNSSSQDYRLLPGSPAKDAGTNVSSFGVDQDYKNQARPYPAEGSYDVGAFEYKN